MFESGPVFESGPEFESGSVFESGPVFDSGPAFESGPVFDGSFEGEHATPVEVSTPEATAAITDDRGGFDSLGEWFAPESDIDPPSAVTAPESAAYDPFDLFDDNVAEDVAPFEADSSYPSVAGYTHSESPHMAESQPGFVQPGFVQPEFVQPEFVQPDFVQPEFVQAAFTQPEDGFVTQIAPPPVNGIPFDSQLTEYPPQGATPGLAPVYPQVETPWSSPGVQWPEEVRGVNYLQGYPGQRKKRKSGLMQFGPEGISLTGKGFGNWTMSIGWLFVENIEIFGPEEILFTNQIKIDASSTAIVVKATDGAEIIFEVRSRRPPSLRSSLASLSYLLEAARQFRVLYPENQ